MLEWIGTDTTASAFLVERCAGTGCSGFTQIDSIAAKMSAYQSGGLNAATSYGYRIRAISAAGPSGYSSIATATTLGGAAPSLTLGTTVLTYDLGASWIRVDPMAMVRDPDSPNFDGGVLSIALVVPDSSVQLGFASSSITLGGTSLTYGMTSVGVVGWEPLASRLTVTFNSASTVAIVESVVRALAYRKTSGKVPVRQVLRLQLTDGDGNASDTVDRAIDVSSSVAPPTALAVTGLTSSEIVLTWIDQATNEVGYLVERCAGLGCGDFRQVDSLGANAQDYRSGGLAAASSYSFRVGAVGLVSRSAYSNVATGTTAGALPAPPGAPTSLSATAVASGEVALQWTDAATTEAGYLVERCSGAGCMGFIQIDSLGANTATYRDGNRISGTSYSYRVRATNPGGRSAYSNTATATTLPTLVAPSNLVATPRSARIDLSWTSPTSGGTNNRIDRCAGTDCTNFAALSSVPISTAAYSDATAAVNTSYSYRVLACGGGGSCSNPSNIVTTSIATTRPAAPSGLKATAVSRTQISLTWTDNAGDETSFRIDRCQGEGCTSFTTLTAVGADVTTFQDTGLAASTSYSYRVRAVNAAGNSSFSNTTSATTLPK